ncbi:hypothetical protein EAH76_16855 [Sphingomonas glacialis]|uniref:Uncharacterized protein n=1 Tax=Sphingomonas glacialis TaxID=658225 RepID=A0A502FQJ6_9SPHN|nr:hypothetical protein EAH76_16855 [Sphingomonas glacialis]
MRITRRRFQQPDTIGWADSRGCPAMLPVLKAMRTLAVPRPTVPGMEQRLGSIIVDGIGYRLRTQARFDGGGGAVGLRLECRHAARRMGRQKS